MSITKWISYSIEKKLIVIKYTQKNKRNVATNHFDLNSPIIERWIKKNNKLKKENKKKKHIK